MKILKETSTTEFIKLNNCFYVIFNGTKLKLDDFVKNAKHDNEIAKVLLAIQKKMKSLNFKGNIIQFVKQAFSFNDTKPDVLIKDGTRCLGTGDKESFATFDVDEINKSILLRRYQA